MNSNRMLTFISLIGILLIGFLFYSIYAKAKEDAKHIKLESSETLKFELLKVGPPKHFYVDIKDLRTGEIRNRVYVSKHCNNWRETAIVGKVYQIVVETYHDDRDNSLSLQYKNLYEVLCK